MTSPTIWTCIDCSQLFAMYYVAVYHAFEKMYFGKHTPVLPFQEASPGGRREQPAKPEPEQQKYQHQHPMTGLPASASRRQCSQRRCTPSSPSTARAPVAAPLRPRPSSAGRRPQPGGVHARTHTGKTRRSSRARRRSAIACGCALPRSRRGAAMQKMSTMF